MEGLLAKSQLNWFRRASRDTRDQYMKGLCKVLRKQNKKKQMDSLFRGKDRERMLYTLKISSTTIYSSMSMATHSISLPLPTSWTPRKFIASNSELFKRLLVRIVTQFKQVHNQCQYLIDLPTLQRAILHHSMSITVLLPTIWACTHLSISRLILTLHLGMLIHRTVSILPTVTCTTITSHHLRLFMVCIQIVQAALLIQALTTILWCTHRDTHQCRTWLIQMLIIHTLVVKWFHIHKTMSQVLATINQLVQDKQRALRTNANSQVGKILRFVAQRAKKLLHKAVRMDTILSS